MINRLSLYYEGLSILVTIWVWLMYGLGICYNTVRITRAIGVIIRMTHSSRQVAMRTAPCISSKRYHSL